MKKRLKKTARFILIVSIGLVSFILIYLSAAYILSRITVDGEINTKEEVAIYILTNGVHTDIVVPIKTEGFNWSEKVKFDNTVSKDTSYNFLALGWGDKGFYLETPEWKDLKASVALKAAFALSNSAIHTTFYKRMTESENCKKVMISSEQYKRLTNYIYDSFQKDKDGNFINIITDANYGSSDAFYEANGRYSIFHTCNTWANNGLKTCGQKSCLWTIFDTGIFLKYE